MCASIPSLRYRVQSSEHKIRRRSLYLYLYSTVPTESAMWCLWCLWCLWCGYLSGHMLVFHHDRTAPQSRPQPTFVRRRLSVFCIEAAHVPAHAGFYRNGRVPTYFKEWVPSTVGKVLDQREASGWGCNPGSSLPGPV